MAPPLRQHRVSTFERIYQLRGPTNESASSADLPTVPPTAAVVVGLRVAVDDSDGLNSSIQVPSSRSVRHVAKGHVLGANTPKLVVTNGLVSSSTERKLDLYGGGPPGLRGDYATSHASRSPVNSESMPGAFPERGLRDLEASSELVVDEEGGVVDVLAETSGWRRRLTLIKGKWSAFRAKLKGWQWSGGCPV